MATGPFEMPVCGAEPVPGKRYGPCFRFVHEPDEGHESEMPGLPGQMPTIVTWFTYREDATP